MKLALAIVCLPSLALAGGTALNPGTAKRSANFVAAPDFTRKPVLANPRAACGAADRIKERIEGGRWSEVLRGLGLSGDTLANLYVAPSGTWTVFIEDSRGVGCIVASGTDWQQFSAGEGS